jgi:hypothetical protein
MLSTYYIGLGVLIGAVIFIVVWLIIRDERKGQRPKDTRPGIDQYYDEMNAAMDEEATAEEELRQQRRRGTIDSHGKIDF